jgi:3-hydroxyisobutyrate dehydrogenase-like beta-hydroxyacid dehydrogenase
MGSLMASRLLAAGYPVTVWNRTKQRATLLIEAGAQGSVYPADAVEGKDLIITMLTDPDAVTDVLFGKNGVGQSLAAGAVLVEMSTIGPAAVATLRKRLPDSVGLVDAPVQGGTPQAQAGELKIFVGGAAADVAAVNDALSVLGKTHHIGPLGAGAAIKLVVNSVLATSVVMVGEALALADRLGLDTDTALDALADTAVGPLISRLRARLADPTAAPGFTLGLAEKDMRLVREAGVADGGAVAGAQSRLTAAIGAGLGESDLSAVLSFLRSHATSSK